MGFFSLFVIKIPQIYVLYMFHFFLYFGHRKRTEMYCHASMAILLKHLFPFFYIHYKMKNLYVHHGLHRCHLSCCICSFRITENILHGRSCIGESHISQNLFTHHHLPARSFTGMTVRVKQLSCIAGSCSKFECQMLAGWCR